MSGAGISRTKAFLAMQSPLGPDALIPSALTLEEAISEPFLAVVDVVSSEADIDPDKLLYHSVCITLKRPEREPRHVHGFVRRCIATGARARGMFGYRLEVVPKLWFLSQTGDCRIFENKSSKDIVQTLCSEGGVDVVFRVSAPPARPFTVQYNETDLAFATRLIEEEGWFYLFEHTESAHRLIIADSESAFTNVPRGNVARGPGDGPDVLATWQPGRATAHGKIALADYDPKQAATVLSGETKTQFSTAGASSRDLFQWPALTLQNESIRQRTRQRIEAAEAEAVLAEGSGSHEGFIPGGRIQVSPRVGGEPTKFVLRRVRHEATDATWENTAASPTYRNSFSAFPANTRWRPQATVPRPRMDGLYSAVVIGPDGQEIYTDEMGRVKLRFRWDHRSDATPGGAIWVRVMQAWAGPQGGWLFIPRVGTEVLVAFMDGDPDRPVVVGQVHNGEHAPPWSLPDEKTRSGLRTRSTPQGGEQNASEFWFDDKRGAEKVFLHAERDLQVEVENDATHSITGNRSVTLSQGDDKVTVQQGSRTVAVPLGDHSITSKTGNISVKTDAGAITLEAMQSLTLKVGQSSVTLDQSGVTIKGMTVSIEGQMLTSLKGTITKLDADALFKAASGIMMLN